MGKQWGFDARFCSIFSGVPQSPWVARCTGDNFTHWFCWGCAPRHTSGAHLPCTGLTEGPSHRNWRSHGVSVRALRVSINPHVLLRPCFVLALMGLCPEIQGNSSCFSNSGALALVCFLLLGLCTNTGMVRTFPVLVLPRILSPAIGAPMLTSSLRVPRLLVSRAFCVQTPCQPR